MHLDDIKLAVIGLGYVGLPLAVEFGRKRPVVGFDINQRRLDELRTGNDFTLEITQAELESAKHLSYTNNVDDLRDCNYFIVTVPTPIDEYKRPDLATLMNASETIGTVLKSGDIVTAGTHPAESIKIAEAAKVIENIQRDVNITLINELAIIFNKMGIDTEAVLKGAGSKWNYLPFRPGLVGGNYIGVDPYYLTYKAQAIGYHPEIILAGRRLNNGMGCYVVAQLVKAMILRRIHVDGAKVLVMGLAFKENCPDLRNTRVVDIVAELWNFTARWMSMIPGLTLMRPSMSSALGRSPNLFQGATMLLFLRSPTYNLKL